MIRQLTFGFLISMMSSCISSLCALSTCLPKETTRHVLIFKFSNHFWLPDFNTLSSFYRASYASTVLAVTVCLSQSVRPKPEWYKDGYPTNNAMR